MMILLRRDAFESILSWRDGHPSTYVHIAFLSAANTSHAHCTQLTRRMLIQSHLAKDGYQCVFCLKVLRHKLLRTKCMKYRLK